MSRGGEPRRPASRRLVASLSDEGLVAYVRRGSDFAFEELFDRHRAGVLSLCSRILKSHEAGEDALQHAFLAVHRAVGERSFEPRAFKPWLFAIARNHCFSVLRSARETAPSGDDESLAVAEQTADLGEQTADLVERRAEVRALLRDVRDLPEPQRAALLLSELGDLSHAQIAQIIACPREKVKALVFQARATLGLDREARETSCSRVREELASSPGARLPLGLRRHLKRCEGCSELASEVRGRPDSFRSRGRGAVNRPKGMAPITEAFVKRAGGTASTSP